MSRVLPRFVPITAVELAETKASASLVFLGDVCRIHAVEGADTLRHSLGSALPGRLEAPVRITPHIIVSRAVQSDGAVLDVALLPPLDATPPPFPAGIFVYGTLMTGEEREAAIRQVLPHVHPTTGWVTGGLVHLGAWPGLVNGTGCVHGELFLTDELAPLLAVLDPVEDFTGFHRPPTEYVRVVLPVTTATGQTWAWAYRHVGDGSEAVAIPSGRWRDAPRRLPSCPVP